MHGKNNGKSYQWHRVFQNAMKTTGEMSGRHEDAVWRCFDKHQNLGERKTQWATCRGCGAEISALVVRAKNHAEKCAELRKLGLWSVGGGGKIDRHLVLNTQAPWKACQTAIARFVYAQNLSFRYRLLWGYLYSHKQQFQERGLERLQGIAPNASSGVKGHHWSGCWDHPAQRGLWPGTCASETPTGREVCHTKFGWMERSSMLERDWDYIKWSSPKLHWHGWHPSHCRSLGWHCWNRDCRCQISIGDYNLRDCERFCIQHDRNATDLEKKISRFALKLCFSFVFLHHGPEIFTYSCQCHILHLVVTDFTKDKGRETIISHVVLVLKCFRNENPLPAAERAAKHGTSLAAISNQVGFN